MTSTWLLNQTSPAIQMGSLHKKDDISFKDNRREFIWLSSIQMYFTKQIIEYILQSSIWIYFTYQQKLINQGKHETDAPWGLYFEKCSKSFWAYTFPVYWNPCTLGIISAVLQRFSYDHSLIFNWLRWKIRADITTQSAQGLHAVPFATKAL